MRMGWGGDTEPVGMIGGRVCHSFLPFSNAIESDREATQRQNYTCIERDREHAPPQDDPRDAGRRIVHDDRWVFRSSHPSVLIKSENRSCCLCFNQYYYKFSSS
jgi:hypothetical protein